MTRRHNLRTLDTILACLLVRDCVAFCLRRLHYGVLLSPTFDCVACFSRFPRFVRSSCCLLSGSVLFLVLVVGCVVCPSVGWFLFCFVLLVVVAVLFCCCSGLLDRTALTSTYHACTCDAPGSRCFAWYRITFRTTRLLQPGLSTGCWPFVFRCWLC